MKIRKLLLFPLMALLALATLLSCGEDRWAEYRPLTGRNLWMDSVMRAVYLWHEDIPASKNLNYFQAPQAFLKSMLSDKDKGYSTIDTLYHTPVPGYGIDYTLYKVGTSDTTFNALVKYVASDSPAAVAGLERGEWVMLIDGDSITKKTEKRLNSGGARKLRIGKYAALSVGEDQKVGVVRPHRDLAMPAARVVSDDVVGTAAIYRVNDKMVGYLAYHSFSAGSAAGSQHANDKLRLLSQEYKQEGVNNFVLDLRYNTGGEMECVQLLASILVPAEKLGSPLASLQYNNKQSAKNRELKLDPQLLQGAANLNLPRVYILTGSATAGAAEMLINCLSPYMNVVLIGQTTKGEHVATETFLNPQYPWALRPVVCQVFNALGEADYSAGFAPAYAVSESSHLEYFLPLGNPDEALLNTALSIIAGGVEASQAQTTVPMARVKSVQLKRSFHNGLIIE